MKYVPPGLPGSIVSVEPRYENFIGGKWLAPTHGKYRVDLAPATAGPITEVADSTPEDVELALDAAHAAKDAWGEASAAEPSRGAQRDRRCDREEPGDAGGRRELGERQAGPRDPGRRHSPGRRSLPVLRRRGARRGGPLDRDRQGPGRLPLPGAARCGRSDHPVQLPAADGGVEARPGAGGG